MRINLIHSMPILSSKPPDNLRKPLVLRCHTEGSFPENELRKFKERRLPVLCLLLPLILVCTAQ